MNIYIPFKRMDVFSVVLLAFSITTYTIANTIPTLSPVISLCRQPGMFALTFDGGPSIYTGTVLDAFDQRNLKATFHPVVSYLEEVTLVANIQRAAQEGHLIGMAIENSIDLSTMSDGDIMQTIESRAKIVQSFVGYKPQFLRLPNYKNMTDDQLNMIISKGYTITTYNLDSYDYLAKTQDDVMRPFVNILGTLSNNTKGGFISVQRDTSQISCDSTGAILDYLLGKGYNIVTLDVCTAMPLKNPASGSTPKSSGPTGNTSMVNSGTNRTSLSASVPSSDTVSAPFSLITSTILLFAFGFSFALF